DKKEAPQDDQQARLEISVELANTENNLMMRGKEVPPTAYQPAAHTLIHVKFTSSPTFQNLKKDDPIVKNFIEHITGEIAAQQDRGTGGISAPAGAEETVPPGGGVATPTPGMTQD